MKIPVAIKILNEATGPKANVEFMDVSIGTGSCHFLVDRKFLHSSILRPVLKIFHFRQQMAAASIKVAASTCSPHSNNEGCRWKKKRSKRRWWRKKELCLCY